MDQVIVPAEQPRFVVCLRNEEWPLDLKVGAVYRVLADLSAERSGWIRVIDETGEDYLFPAEYFHPLDLPGDVARTLAEAVSRPEFTYMRTRRRGFGCISAILPERVRPLTATRSGGGGCNGDGGASPSDIVPPRLQERMNSPLEIRKVRLRGLRAEGVPARICPRRTRRWIARDHALECLRASPLSRAVCGRGAGGEGPRR
jgi:hypothetical protein